MKAAFKLEIKVHLKLELDMELLFGRQDMLLIYSYISAACAVVLACDLNNKYFHIFIDA